MGARYLDPRTGRFTQPDPVGLVDPATGKVNQEMLLNPQRLNRYVYGLNNPYKYVDPEGDFAILAAYGGYIMASALAAGIAYYGGPIAADLGKRLHHVIWNGKNQSSTPKGPAGTAKDARKKVRKGQGPRDLGRIDKPEKNIPGSQWHAHGKGKKKGALNADGTVHDKHKGAPDFSGETKKWLQSHGWKIKRK